MRRNVLVVSHADADGHLIAEQARRNLELIPTFSVSILVDPLRTKDHKVWGRLDDLKEIEDADIVFFVDLMFSPESFVKESKALARYAQDRPQKLFFLVDHHPIPHHRLEPARNLRAVYRPEVFECVFGPQSGMMVVAALCERQNATVADIKRPVHEVLATGMRRAAALGGPLPGEKLLALLRTDSWGALAKLGEDDPANHRLPRGRRPVGQPQSDVLKELDQHASNSLAHLVADSSATSQPRQGMTMSYDFDSIAVGQERFGIDPRQGHRRRNIRIDSADLEAIVTLLEVAALSLTDTPDATFTLEELINEACELGGDEIAINEKDVKIVLEKARFVEKVGAGQFRLR